MEFLPPGVPRSSSCYIVTPPVLAPPAPDAAVDDRLHDYKQLLIDRFAHFRLGLKQYVNYDREGRRHIRQHIAIPPNPGPWPGHPRVVERSTIHAIRRSGVLARILPWGKSARVRRAADRAAAALARDFRPARFRFRKRLGYGGFGAAFLFEMSDEDGYVLPIVVKADITGRRRLRATQKEKHNFVRMAGAQHFVQRYALQSFPLPARPTSTLGRLRGLFSRMRVGHNNAPVDSLDEDLIEAARRELDQRRDIIIMEYMARGNIHNLIAKLQGKDRLSNRMLWLIFECLFKACIAMAYPSRFCPPDQDPWNEIIMPQDETAPNDVRLPDAPMVHFDIDPQNALVGKFGYPDDDHGSVPIVKIADPGLSEIVDWKFRTDEWELWAQRTVGKPEFLLPEQFTPEWDYEASRGLEDLSRQETAGNYHWWSNLYQVGWVMWCLITQCMPPFPPVASPYSYPAEDERITTLNGHSYGLIIFSREFEDYDARLRHLIVRCLDHNPTKRPGMIYMEHVITANVERVDLREREPDEELVMNAHRIFGEPF